LKNRKALSEGPFGFSIRSPGAFDAGTQTGY
jgi:hypothetical protein